MDHAAHAGSTTGPRRTEGRPLGRALRVLDRWFRGWGIVTLGLLATTALALLVDARWRLPFLLAHLAALIALLPLGLTLTARALIEGRERAGSWAAAPLEVARRYPLTVALVLVACVTIALSLANFEDGNRAVRSTANLATVAVIAVLVVRYLRSRGADRA